MDCLLQIFVIFDSSRKHGLYIEYTVEYGRCYMELYIIRCQELLVGFHRTYMNELLLDRYKGFQRIRSLDKVETYIKEAFNTMSMGDCMLCLPTWA